VQPQLALLLGLLPQGSPNNPAPQKKLIHTSRLQHSTDLEAFLEPQLQMACPIDHPAAEVSLEAVIEHQRNLGRMDWLPPRALANRDCQELASRVLWNLSSSQREALDHRE
jgi:hypothetical protein